MIMRRLIDVQKPLTIDSLFFNVSVTKTHYMALNKLIKIDETVEKVCGGKFQMR